MGRAPARLGVPSRGAFGDVSAWHLLTYRITASSFWGISGYPLRRRRHDRGGLSHYSCLVMYIQGGNVDTRTRAITTPVCISTLAP